MKIYRSKIGFGIVLPIALILGTALVLSIYQQVWPVTLLLALILTLVAHMLLTTYYTITGATLKISCGFLYKLSIPVSDIRKIEENWLALSSPAASMDRIELFYDKYDSVLVSPKQKAEFIAHLLEINPAIEVKLKQKAAGA